MAKLTYQRRKSLPKRSFIFKRGGPGGRGRYPIDTAARARNALARVSAFGTPAEKAKVRAAVRRRFPSIKITSIKSK